MARAAKTGAKKAAAAAVTLAEQLKRHRRRLGLTQAELAAKADVSADTISDIEIGRGKPRERTIRKLATALALRGPAHPTFVGAGIGGGVARPPSVRRPKAAPKAADGGRRTLQVFLCHSSGDKADVRKLYRSLKRESGIKPWLDEEDLLPGQDWDAEIRKAVRASDIVIVCLSEASITKTGYVQQELRFALDIAEQQPEGKIYIIPLRLESCELPFSLQRYHRVDYFTPGGYGRLVASLRTRGSSPRTPCPAPPRPKRRAGPAKARK